MRLPNGRYRTRITNGRALIGLPIGGRMQARALLGYLCNFTASERLARCGLTRACCRQAGQRQTPLGRHPPMVLLKAA